MDKGKAYKIFLIYIVLVSGVAGVILLSIFKQEKTNKTITNTKIVRIIIDDNYPPYTFRGENGELRGILIDLWKLWQRKTGIKAQITGVDWNIALEAMKKGEYDVIDTAFMDKDRLTYLDFGKPYTKIEVSIFYHKNISGITDIRSLKGFIVAAKKGDYSVNFLRKNGINNILEFPNYESIIDAAKEGKVKVFVVDKPPAFYFLYKKNLEDQFKVSSPLYTGEFHRAVKKGNIEMLQLIENGFAKISPREFQAIERKWFGTTAISLYYSRFFKYFLYFLITVAFMVILLLLWNYSLQREAKKRTLEIFREKELFRTTILSIGDGVVTTDQAGRITALNRAAEEIVGWREEEVKGRPLTQFFKLISEDTGKEVEDPVTKVLTTGKITGLGNYTILLAKDGRKIPVGQIFGVVMVFHDVTQEKAWKEKILYLSSHDPLTGLYNRWFMEEQLKQMDRTQELPLAVIMADINGLKLVNDAFGHEEGDKLLKKVAEVLKESGRKDDLLARWGGDEFLFLLPRNSVQEVEEIIEKIRNRCLQVSDMKVQLSMAMGYAVKTQESEKIEEIIKEAEKWMYRRKLIEGKSYRSAIINTLLATLSAKSTETEEHAERLKNYCLTIGKEMKLSDC